MMASKPTFVGSVLASKPTFVGSVLASKCALDSGMITYT